MTVCSRRARWTKHFVDGNLYLVACELSPIHQSIFRLMCELSWRVERQPMWRVLILLKSSAPAAGLTDHHIASISSFLLISKCGTGKFQGCVKFMTRVRSIPKNASAPGS